MSNRLLQSQDQTHIKPQSQQNYEPYKVNSQTLDQYANEDHKLIEQIQSILKREKQIVSDYNSLIYQKEMINQHIGKENRLNSQMLKLKQSQFNGSIQDRLNEQYRVIAEQNRMITDLQNDQNIADSRIIELERENQKKQEQIDVWQFNKNKIMEYESMIQDLNDQLYLEKQENERMNKREQNLNQQNEYLTRQMNQIIKNIDNKHRDIHQTKPNNNYNQNDRYMDYSENGQYINRGNSHYEDNRSMKQKEQQNNNEDNKQISPEVVEMQSQLDRKQKIRSELDKLSSKKYQNSQSMQLKYRLEEQLRETNMNLSNIHRRMHKR